MENNGNTLLDIELKETRIAVLTALKHQIDNYDLGVKLIVDALEHIQDAIRETKE